MTATISDTLLKRLLAAFVFVFTLGIYIDTMAGTVSFWDCGEFIATAYTMAVPHPPGSPLYLLLGRVFSMLPIYGGAAFDPILNQPEFHLTAFRITMMSPLVTAFSNMFLFLIIVRMVVEWRGKVTTSRDQWIAYVGGLVGALALAFSDSHWFNAVEAEVYSMSIFFTAIVAWLILKWSERVEEGQVGARYLLLIAYIMGLAISVHMLNLLTIPFIALIMYYKLNPEEDGVELMVNVISQIAIMTIGFLIAVQMVLPETSMEYMRQTDAARSQNLMSMAVIILIVGVAGLWGLSQAFDANRRKRFWKQFFMVAGAGAGFLAINLGIISGMPKLAGLVSDVIQTDSAVVAIATTFSLSVIALMIVIYLAPTIFKARAPEARLILTAFLLVLLGYTSYQTIFIRSTQNPNIDENDPETPRQAVAYLEREQYGSYPVFYRDRWETRPISARDARPGMTVQVGASNKIGVISGYGDPQRKTVPVRFGRNESTVSVSEIGHIVNNYTGSIDYFFRYQISKMYFRYFKWQFWGRVGDNADISQLWALPFLLGLLGMGHQFTKDPKRAFAVLGLFLLTGLAIILYLNQNDPQPRERDYSYVGSFFAYAIWIGLGASALLEILTDKFKNNQKLIMMATSIVLIAAVPANMLFANYQEHDRSGNYVAWEYSYNLLNTCEPNAVIFTNGDNDTFPLWYLQEVEKIRTDVRVINLSLLNTPWYIKQLKNIEPKIQISLSDKQIDDLQLWRWEEREVYIPGSTPNADGIRWNLKPTISRQRNSQNGKLVGGLKIQDIMILEIIRANNWIKPIYFAVTISPSNKLELEPYLRMDGQAYRLLDYRTDPNTADLEMLYKNAMEVYRYTNLNNASITYPENVKRLLQNYRTGFLQLAIRYGMEGDNEKALKVIRKMDESITDDAIPYTHLDIYLQVIQFYKEFGDTVRGQEMLEKAFTNGRERYSSTNDLMKVGAIWNDLFDMPKKTLEILVPEAQKLANTENAQIMYEVTRAYIKDRNAVEGTKWLDKLAVLIPNAPEINMLRENIDMIEKGTQG
jgi:tetratricopeptide (TPR) repeat protein